MHTLCWYQKTVYNQTQYFKQYLVLKLICFHAKFNINIKYRKYKTCLLLGSFHFIIIIIFLVVNNNFHDCNAVFVHFFWSCIRTLLNFHWLTRKEGTILDNKKKLHEMNRWTKWARGIIPSLHFHLYKRMLVLFLKPHTFSSSSPAAIPPPFPWFLTYPPLQALAPLTQNLTVFLPHSISPMLFQALVPSSSTG